MENLSDRLSDTRVRALLAMTLGVPTDERVEQAASRYARSDSWRLFGMQVNDELVGLVGVELTSDRDARVQHLAVAEPFRRHGVGRRLLECVVEQLHLERLFAETDDEAVAFYRNSGFSVHDAPPRFGRRRYECEFRAHAPPEHAA